MSWGGGGESPAALDGILFLEDFDDGAGDDGRWSDESPGAPRPEKPEIADARRIGFAAGRDAGLHEGRAEGRAAGRDEGRAEASAADTAACRAALEAVAARVAGLDEQARRAVDADSAALARLVMGLFAAFWPALSERHGDAEAAALARALLPALAREPSVVVRAAPRAAALIADVLSAAAAAAADGGVAGRVRVVAAEAMPPGDLHVAWDQGEAVRDTGALWPAILDILTPAGLAPGSADHPAPAMENHDAA